MTLPQSPTARRNPVWVAVKAMLATVVAAVFVVIPVLAITALYLFAPLPDWVKLLASIVVIGGIGWLLFAGWRKMFRYRGKPGKVLSVAALFIALALPLAVFAIPSNVPALAARQGFEPVKDKYGQAIAVWHFTPTTKSSEVPLVYVNGGPGGPLGDSTFNFVKQFADQGLDTYAYDSLGTGSSARSTDPTRDYTIDAEVERLHDVVKATGATKVALMGHSYAGALIPRFLVKYPDLVDKYIAIDASPLYTLQGNTPAESEQQTKNSKNSGAGSLPAPTGTDPNSLREYVRGLAQMLGVQFTGRLPFGTTDEVDNFFTNMARSTDADAKGKPATTRIGVLPSLLINKSMTKSADYTTQLRAATAKIPVLLFHPEKGVVPWFIHNDFRKYFANYSVIPVAGADHGVWESTHGNDVLVRDVTAFVKNQPLPDPIWTSADDPFKK